MVTKDDRDTSQTAVRKARLAEQLRANLQRRKQQARARRAGEADERPEGIGRDMAPMGMEPDKESGGLGPDKAPAGIEPGKAPDKAGDGQA